MNCYFIPIMRYKQLKYIRLHPTIYLINLSLNYFRNHWSRTNISGCYKHLLQTYYEPILGIATEGSSTQFIFFFYWIHKILYNRIEWKKSSIHDDKNKVNFCTWQSIKTYFGVVSPLTIQFTRSFVPTFMPYIQRTIHSLAFFN